MHNGNHSFFSKSAYVTAVLCVALMFNNIALGLQEKTPAPQAGAQAGAPSGVATAGPHAPVKDALSRPITAGGFVDGAPVIFTDITAKSGLGSFKHRSGMPEKNYILEVPGSGVALLDYDNDGWLDIYLVNGSTFDALSGKEKPPRAALFHNNHDGTFTDVTAKAGVANERWGFGVAVGDFDNDGWPDIYVSNFGKNRLYHNNHDGTFTDVAEKAGVALGGWSTGVTFGDYDGDGKLDLFVAGYVKFDVNNLPTPGSGGVSYGYCQYRGQNVMCGPRGLRGEHDHLFHNNGDGTFTDVSEKAGVSDPNGYYGFSAVFADVNGDGRPDLIVANDSTPNYLYLNKGDGTFEDASYASGVAVNESGREQAAMGLAIGDYNNDGKLDVHTTNFSDDYNTLFKNEGDGSFTDVSFEVGIGEPTVPFLGWGVGFLDFDNDGFKDIFAANGHLYPSVDKNDWGTTWAQRPLLFRNIKGEKFELVPAATGSGLSMVLPARGAAFGDLFNTGQIDVVINNLDSQPTVLRNMITGNNWLTLKLVGGPKSPTDAVGTTVWLTANGATQRVDVISGGSFLSNSDMRPHFGIGKATRVEKLEIHWPSGLKQVVEVPEINRILTAAEGGGIVQETKKREPSTRKAEKRALRLKR